MFAAHPPQSSPTWSFRINDSIGIEIVPHQQQQQQNAPSNNHREPDSEYSIDGTLKALSLVNFTGRLVFYRAPEPTDHSISFNEGDLHENQNRAILDEENRDISDVSVFKTEDSPASKQSISSSPKSTSKRGGGLLNNLAFLSNPSDEKKEPSLDMPDESGETVADQEVASSPRPQQASMVSTIRSSLSGRPRLARNMDVLRKLLVTAARHNQKRSIPDKIRSKRHQKRLADLRSVSDSPPTKLHELCALSSVTLEQLFECYNENPSSIKTKDHMGRFPLHILGDNDALVMSDSGREVATVFSGHLINEHSAVTYVPDNDGFIPFSRILADWVDWANDQEEMREDTGHATSPRSLSALFYTGRYHGFFAGRQRDHNHSAESPPTHHWHFSSAKNVSFPRVEVWIEADWCFQMLSTAIDILGRNQSLPTFRRARMAKMDENADQRDDRRVLSERLIRKIPTLFCMVLLVDDDGMDTRQRILEMVLFRRLLLCEKTIGKWLIYMLNHGGAPSKRAVDFLCLVSRTTISDFTGGYGTAHSFEWEKFNEEREQVFEAVCDLRGMVASLVTLDTKETERAASTAVVWHTMSNKLARPFVLGLVLIDLILHLTLMVSFREVAKLTTNLNQAIELDPNSVILFICSHYLLRKGCEGWVLLTVSTSAFNSYFTNMWNLFDSASIVLTLYATVWQAANEGEINTGLNTLIIGLLWLKVLGFLKVVNKSMSTFIMALAQILYDIRLFMIVLTVCIFMFGDMFHVAVSTKDDGTYCSTLDDPSGTIEDFCTSSWDSYLRVYSILLGDFELDDINATIGTTILFLIFTIIGVIILLNVLIAVIGDSYERATLNGNLLFGRARVLYVAQNEALEEFLKPRPGGHGSGDRNPVHARGSRRARSLLRWTVLVAIIGCAVYAFLFLIGLLVELSRTEDWFLFSLVFFMAWCLFLSLWVVATFVADGIFRNLLPDTAENVYDVMNKANGCLVRFISRVLFGVNKEKVQTLSDKEASEQDWMGRIKYLETIIQKEIAESKNELKSEIMEMRAEMHQHFDAEEKVLT